MDDEALSARCTLAVGHELMRGIIHELLFHELLLVVKALCICSSGGEDRGA